jgi:hypothetical protein
MQKAKEYKELYVSADEYYIIDYDTEYDTYNNILEKPFINYLTNDNNNDNNDNNNDNNYHNDNDNDEDDEDDQINDFNKITDKNKIEACEIGTNTDKIMCDKSTITEKQLVNNALANSISSDMGCEKIFKCMCVIS